MAGGSDGGQICPASRMSVELGSGCLDPAADALEIIRVHLDVDETAVELQGGAVGSAGAHERAEYLPDCSIAPLPLLVKISSSV